jgi:hypothetical protein
LAIVANLRRFRISYHLYLKYFGAMMAGFIGRFIGFFILGAIVFFLVKGEEKIALLYGFSALMGKTPPELSISGMCEVGSFSSCYALVWHNYWWIITGVLALVTNDGESNDKAE